MFHFIHRWNQFNVEGEPTKFKWHSIEDWTNGEALYRRCRGCNRVDHKIRLTCGQGDIQGSYWEKENIIMKQYGEDILFGAGVTLNQLQSSCQKVRKDG